MASNGITCKPNFVNIGHLVQKLKGECSLKPTFSFGIGKLSNKTNTKNVHSSKPTYDFYCSPCGVSVGGYIPVTETKNKEHVNGRYYECLTTVCGAQYSSLV